MFINLTRVNTSGREAAYRVNTENVKQYYPSNIGTHIDFMDDSPSINVREAPDVLDKVLGTKDLRIENIDNKSPSQPLRPAVSSTL